MSRPAEPALPSMELEATDSSSVQSTQEVPPSAPTDLTSTEQSSESHSRSRVDSGSGSAGAASAPSRRRRAPASVTSNACNKCKKARAKCDGGRPACKRCTERNVQNECQYDVHAKTAKEQMMREIKRLQKQTESLVEENALLGENNSWTEQIMQSLKENGHSNEIITRLKRGDSHEAIATWLQHPEVGVLPPMSPVTERKISQAIEQLHRVFIENSDSLYWTNVARVPALVETLIKLYLAWIHPVHMLFDEKSFRHSFQTRSDNYCSRSMVNAMCAMACHFLHDSYGRDDAARESISSLRDQFVDETKSRIEENPDYTKMTTIQTYAIMFLVDLSSGHGSLATLHLRLAVEHLLVNVSAEQTPEAHAVASWGILTLHTAWSGFTYQKPSAPISTTANPFENLIKQKSSDSPGQLYPAVPNKSAEEDERTSHALEMASEHAKLFRIVHANILIYCGSRGKVDTQQLLQLYERYLAWKEGLPSDVAELSDESPSHVLFLHIQYHTVLVHLLQPLLHLDGYNEDTYQALRQHLLNHARTGLYILHQYQSMYSTYILTPLQIFCMVHICEALVRYDIADSQSPTIAETVDFCLSSLQEIRVFYPVAGPLQQMFRNSLKEQGISISEELQRVSEASANLSQEELLDACTRLTYRQPVSQIMMNMEPGLGQSFMDTWREMTGEKAARTQKGKHKAAKPMDIADMLN